MGTVRVIVRSTLLMGLSCALLPAFPAAIAAQEEVQEAGAARPPGPSRAARPATELVFEREVFAYPTFQRRNPFRPLVGGDSGPRFESMSVQGIVYVADNPSQSMVLMLAGGGGTTEAQSRRLRAGQGWGNVRVLEIRRTEVTVEVEEFGITEQRIMQLPTRGQGGS
ncbi:MAG: hypothetical protein PVI57_05225 [Gemmatimonadota bacterium]|jgi:hypothetical protein